MLWDEKEGEVVSFRKKKITLGEFPYWPGSDPAEDPPAAFLGVHEGAGMVPSAISKALQLAVRASHGHVQALSAARDEAAAKKAQHETARAKKMALLEDAKSQALAVEEEEQKSREVMVSLDKAIAAHTLHSGDLDKALELWNQLSSELEVLQKGVEAQEEAMTQSIEAMKSKLENAKKAAEEKRVERDAAEQDMMQKKDKALASGKLKKETEEQQVEAEKRAKKAQEELSAIQARVEEALDEAMKAHLEEAEAGDQVAEAQRKHDKGAESLRLLRKLKEAVEEFFDAMDALDASMMSGTGVAYERILTDTNLAPALTKYNLMVVAFTDVFSFDDATFRKVEPAIPQIVLDTKAAMELACDPTKELGQSMAESPELEEKCWTNLWRKLAINELPFPGQSSSTAAASGAADNQVQDAPAVEESASIKAREMSKTEPATTTIDVADLTNSMAVPAQDMAGNMNEEQLEPSTADLKAEAEAATTTTEDLTKLLNEDETDAASKMTQGGDSMPLQEDSGEPLREEIAKALDAAPETPQTSAASTTAEDSVIPLKEEVPEDTEASAEVSATSTTAEDVAELLGEDAAMSPKVDLAKTTEATPEASAASTTGENLAELLGEDKDGMASLKSDITEKMPEVEAAASTTTAVTDSKDENAVVDAELNVDEALVETSALD
ncbi:unnamed protein product [Symbiodinium pilosum]|uniref:Uncharacterized protein n=1 Tax=Symbiodinium pilosum TaxID=2952 RepID=A0A812MB99_SYMPI|nr:unnamed protein product [Symbiodinium pilosum]